MTNFTRAKVTLQEHDQQHTHKIASITAVDFISCMEKGALSVQHQLRSQSHATVSRNRCVVRSILKTIVFCGKQMIPLRGHREHSEGSDIGVGTGGAEGAIAPPMFQFLFVAYFTFLKYKP